VTVKSPIDVGKSSTTGSWWDAMSAMDYNILNILVWYNIFHI
jgi:hypothetical protein